MTQEKILTGHPLGKRGKNISLENYKIIKDTLLAILKNEELTHTELFAKLVKKLDGKFQGNIGWYGETVKLDLEAKKILERTASKPPTYRLL